MLRITLDLIKERVALGEKITISGFGTFERKRRKATVARNPNTGELLQIAEQNVAVFRAGAGLKEALRAIEG
jgi:DNA-binding protein HU-beta